VKYRDGFVSNSSSSSFVISLDDLTANQLSKIQNHTSWGKQFGVAWEEDAWSIWTDEQNLHGNTMMDNFDMREFMGKIGVDLDKVEFDECH
jgi:hypothetical protein